jgi:MFS family permease
MILYGFLGIIGGKLSDRFGSAVVVTCGGLFVGLSYIFMSQINDVWQIYVIYGLFLSTGLAGVFTPLASNVARLFNRGRGLATGIVMAGVGIGIALIPPLATQFILDYGWRTSYIIIGVSTLVIIAVSAPFLRRKPDPGSVIPERTETIKADRQSANIVDVSFREVIYSRQFWMICIIGFVGAFCVQIIMVHLVPYATDTGISPSDAAILLSVIGWTSIVGKIGLGSYGDRQSNRLAFVIVFALLLLSFFLLQIGSDLQMFVLFAVVFALGYGGSITLLSPIVADYFGLKIHGVLLGFVMFTTNLGSAVGPLAAGGIYDASGSYYWAFIFFAVIAAAGFILSISLKSACR